VAHCPKDAHDFAIGSQPPKVVDKIFWQLVGRLDSRLTEHRRAEFGAQDAISCRWSF
jgi:hypothetical protein